MICERFAGGVFAQPGNAALAAATAASTSLAFANGTDPTTKPVAGLNTSFDRPLVPAKVAPLMKCISVIAYLTITGEQCPQISLIMSVEYPT